VENGEKGSLCILENQLVLGKAGGEGHTTSDFRVAEGKVKNREGGTRIVPTPRIKKKKKKERIAAPRRKGKREEGVMGCQKSRTGRKRRKSVNADKRDKNDSACTKNADSCAMDESF